MYQKLIHIIWIAFIPLHVWSQQNEINENKEGTKGAHRLTTGLGHTHIAKGKDIEGEKVWLLEPSWSFNYDYRISNKWAVGLQTDLVLEKFIVEDEEGGDIEREKPWAVIPVAMFKPFKHFSFIAGTGIEFEKKENMWLTRLGVEFGAELPKGWEAGIALVWDDKWGNYNSWALEFSFSKIFFKRRK